MSSVTALEFNVQKATDELASAEANDILIADLGKKKKAGGGVAARRASAKRVAEARSALALAKEQLQEAQERVSGLDQAGAHSAAPAQTPAIEGLARKDPGSTETSGAATQSPAAKEALPTAPHSGPTSDSTALNFTPGTHGIEPLTATGVAALGPNHIPAVLPPGNPGANLGTPSNLMDVDLHPMDIDPDPVGVDPNPIGINHEIKLEDPREVAAKVEDERARILREGLRESESRLLSQTRSVEEMQELLEAIKDACRGISVAEEAATELRESILIDAEQGNPTALDSKYDTLAELSEDSDKPASKDEVVQKKKRNTKSPDDVNITAWDELNDEAKAELRASGEAEIATYIKSKGKKELSFGLRRQIREVQELLPQAATTSADLALSIFWTVRKNYICRYHQKHRNHHQHDGFKGKYIVKGPAYEKDYDADPEPGHMHCGCAIDVVLAEFFFWKTWTASSTRSDIKLKEPLRDEVIPARLRAFIVQEYMKATCLKLEVLYGEDWGTTEYNRRIMNWQIAEMARVLNKGEPEEVWVLVPRTVVAEA